MDFTEASDNIYFGGQPTLEDLKSMAERGVKTVVNLRLPGEDQSDFPLEQAAAEAEKLGIKYVHIPAALNDFSDGFLENVGQTLQEAKADGSVFIH